MSSGADTLILHTLAPPASRRRQVFVVCAALLTLAFGIIALSNWMDVELVAVLLLILGAEFVNGWTDAPNAMATVVGTRTLTPRLALALAAVFNLVGVMSGTAVATTIGTGIIDPGAVTLTTVAGAMVGIITWSSVAARWGIPTSESHALVAGLAGAGLMLAVYWLFRKHFLERYGESFVGCRYVRRRSWLSATGPMTGRNSLEPFALLWSSAEYCHHFPSQFG